MLDWISRLSGWRRKARKRSRSEPADEAVRRIQELLLSQGELPEIDLPFYRLIMRSLGPPPTEQQMRDFTSYVSEAKSWYKHLPLLPPGETFHFYLDPSAGRDRVLTDDGRVVLFERTDQTPRVHYSWMTTRQYRSRYGHLAFACNAGTRLMFEVSFAPVDETGTEINGMLDFDPSRTSIHLSERTELRLPAEVLETASMQATAVIHPLTARPMAWLGAEREGALEGNRPEDPASREIVDRILRRCREIQDRDMEGGNARRLGEVDEEIDRLLAPARMRQREDMVAAMRRLVSMVYEEPM